MFAVFFTVTVFVTLLAIDPNTGCVTEEDVTEMNTIVDMIKTPLDDIAQNTSLPTHIMYETILGLVCEDQQILTEAKKLEQMVVSCPELVAASNVGTLQIGPLTFNDLLTDFQGFDHFCECKALLYQVIILDMAQTDMTQNDSNAFYKNLINMTAICIPVSSYSYLMKVATLVEAHKASCPSVFKYSEMNIIRLVDFITNHCSYYRPENFACALKYSDDFDLKECLIYVDHNVSLSINYGLDEANYFRCKRSECVDANMALCTRDGILSYMYAVDILQPDEQFQWSTCVPITSASTWISCSFWALLAAIVYTGILRKMM